jgi:type II secretory pathway component PulF
MSIPAAVMAASHLVVLVLFTVVLPQFSNGCLTAGV